MSEETIKLAREWLNKQNLAAWNQAKDVEGLAKFAEQVARECAEIAHMKSNDSCEKSCEYCEIARAIEDAIRAKFGIPEQKWSR